MRANLAFDLRSKQGAEHFRRSPSLAKNVIGFCLRKDLDGTILVLEVKGRHSAEDRTKREFQVEWVRAVNERGSFGRWTWDVSFHPKDADSILRSTQGARRGEHV